MRKQQKIQEEQYKFCYHYLPSFKKGFRLAPVWDYGLQYVATIKFIIEELEKIKFDSLIDIGCGDGRITREIHGHFPNVKIAGIDISKIAIDIAQALNPELIFEENNIINKKKIEKFDIAILIEVIEHINPSRLELFIEKTSEFVSDSGFLLLTTPSKNMKVSAKHFQHFSLKQLFRLLSPYFKVSKSIYLHNPNNIFDLMKKILSNKFFILNYQPLLNYIFNYYYRNIFINKKYRGNGIYILAKKIKKNSEAESI